MSRRLAVLGLVVLVALSGCAGPFGDADTPTPTETDSTGATTTSAETAAATTETTETDDTVSGDVPAGVDDDGTLSDPGALIDAHTRALEETGYETSTNVRVEPQSGGETQVIEYRALVEQGSTPFWIEVNTSVGGELASHQTIWGNDSVRYRRVRQPTGTGNVSAQYDRQSQGSPSIDPGIRAYEQVLEGVKEVRPELPVVLALCHQRRSAPRAFVGSFSNRDRSCRWPFRSVDPPVC